VTSPSVLLLMTDAEFYDGAGFDRAWTEALEAEGAQVQQLARLPEAWQRDGVPPGIDLVVPHVLAEEVAVFGETLRAAAVLESAGLLLTNPVAALLASSDKLATAASWAAAGVPQPRTYALGAAREQGWPDPGRPMVLKPAWGDGAREVVLVEGLEEAEQRVAGWRADERDGGKPRGPAVLQEWVEEPTCVRLFATPWSTSPAYEKDREAGALVTHGTVYPRVYDPPAEVAELAQRAVAALGGGLMGVDVLTDREGRHLVLEANAPFGFDVTDPEQGRFCARAALALAQRSEAAA
jgi:glutathione synthase/RimK-type ligase-like ATP-grasp enzyme